MFKHWKSSNKNKQTKSYQRRWLEVGLVNLGYSRPHEKKEVERQEGHVTHVIGMVDQTGKIILSSSTYCSSPGNRRRKINTTTTNLCGRTYYLLMRLIAPLKPKEKTLAVINSTRLFCSHFLSHNRTI